MESWKIEEFLTAYPTETFPYYRQLSLADISLLEHQFVKKFGPRKLHRMLSVTDALTSIAINEGDYIGTFGNLSHRKIPDSIGTTLRFDFPNLVILEATASAIPESVDEVQFTDLLRFFNYFVGPVEDATIFDPSLKWILVVTHDGEMFFYNRISDGFQTRTVSPRT